jgi:hypothetical protein
VPVATPDAPLSAEDEAEKQIMERLIATFGVFEEQGIFAEITKPQKEQAQKLYKLLRTRMVRKVHLHLLRGFGPSQSLIRKS